MRRLQHHVTCLAILCIFLARLQIDRTELPALQWIGGPLGALIVLAGAALTARLGAALFIALVISGQLLCSLVLDHFALMGLNEQPITAGRVFGALLVVAGVVCIKYL